MRTVKAIFGIIIGIIIFFGLGCIYPFPNKLDLYTIETRHLNFCKLKVTDNIAIYRINGKEVNNDLPGSGWTGPFFPKILGKSTFLATIPEGEHMIEYFILGSRKKKEPLSSIIYKFEADKRYIVYREGKESNNIIIMEDLRKN